MLGAYYRVLLGVAASLSLSLAGCGGDRPAPVAPAGSAAAAPKVAVAGPNAGIDPEDRTDETIWTVLGLAKRNAERTIGPQTGVSVSPILWQATQDTLNFTDFSSEDPTTGLLVTNWYSPPGKPRDRLRVSVFILSRALRSDSLSVTVERQERAATGEWRDATVARDVVTGIENAILQRARQIRAERYRDTMYN